MYAKSFIDLDGNGRLTGARIAQHAPYDRYTWHLCGSALQYHHEYQTGRPWFEQQRDTLTENGEQHCPYVRLKPKKTRYHSQLQNYVSDARLLVYKSDWHCRGCGSDYHGEHYCLICRTGEHSHVLSDADNRTAAVIACAC